MEANGSGMRTFSTVVYWPSKSEWSIPPKEVRWADGVTRTISLGSAFTIDSFDHRTPGLGCAAARTLIENERARGAQRALECRTRYRRSSSREILMGLRYGCRSSQSESARTRIRPVNTTISVAGFPILGRLDVFRLVYVRCKYRELTETSNFFAICLPYAPQP